MCPYRERRDRPQELREPQPGLVTDMVRQFADAYAFLRELVQNSMDAGTERVEVALVRDLDGEVRTSVTDSGSGMTPQIIEGSLLTLFSSSKENDATKIGKYGVGFISVLAIDPLRVEVDTWRAEGAWRVRVQRDHSYLVEELGEGEKRPGSGTTVTLFQSMDSAAFYRHTASARDALCRWCRHARVPIFLTITDYSNPPGSWRGRLDVPLAVHAAASVSELDGEEMIVLGPSAGADQLDWPAELPPHEKSERFIGFYNRGLTLYESSSEVFAGLEGLRVKISSPQLKHTLSRDNVRREKHFEDLLDRARELAKRALPAAVEQALRDQALAVARGEDHRMYVALLGAAASGHVALGAARVWFPLTDPIDGQPALTAKEIMGRSPWRTPLLTWTERDALTAAFAAAGRPVVLCPAARVVQHLAALHDTSSSARCEPAHQRHLLIGAVADPWLNDSALCQEVARVLGAAGTPVASVSLASARGARTPHAVIARDPIVDGAAATCLLSLDQAGAAARKWGTGSTLILDCRHDVVAAARAGAARDLRVAAHLLARWLLLERRGAASAKSNDALLGDFALGAHLAPVAEGTR